VPQPTVFLPQKAQMFKCLQSNTLYHFRFATKAKRHLLFQGNQVRARTRFYFVTPQACAVSSMSLPGLIFG
jgi:hypothetical protein